MRGRTGKTSSLRRSEQSDKNAGKTESLRASPCDLNSSRTIKTDTLTFTSTDITRYNLFIYSNILADAADLKAKGRSIVSMRKKILYSRICRRSGFIELKSLGKLATTNCTDFLKIAHSCGSPSQGRRDISREVGSEDCFPIAELPVCPSSDHNVTGSLLEADLWHAWPFLVHLPGGSSLSYDRPPIGLALFLSTSKKHSLSAIVPRTMSGTHY
jgi:hypothetical protein